jgi:hypothetical protein
MKYAASAWSSIIRDSLCRIDPLPEVNTAHWPPSGGLFSLLPKKQRAGVRLNWIKGAVLSVSVDQRLFTALAHPS